MTINLNVIRLIRTSYGKFYLGNLKKEILEKKNLKLFFLVELLNFVVII